MSCRLAKEHARQLVADAIFQAEHPLGCTPAHPDVNYAQPRALEQVASN